MSFEKLQKEIGQLKNNPINNMTDEQIDELTKKDEEDKKFTENLINVSKETKTYLLDTYMYFTNYKTIKAGNFHKSILSR